MKELFLSLFLACIVSSTCAQKFSSRKQGTFQAGAGVQQVHCSGFTYVVDSIFFGQVSASNGLQPAVLFFYNKEIATRFNVETGLKLYEVSYSYIVGQYHSASGLTVRKVGSVGGTTFNIPVSVEYSFGKFFYLRGGFSVSLSALKKTDNTYFQDAPALSEPFNLIKESFKPVLINYSWGAGFVFGRFDFGYHMDRSIDQLSKPMSFGNRDYKVFSRLSTGFFLLSYHFEIQKDKRKKNKSGKRRTSPKN